MTDTLRHIKQIGDVDEILAEAKRGVPRGSRPRVNTHVHMPPNFSAFETVSQAVSMAARQGVAVLGAGNYYDYRPYVEFTETCRANGVFPLFGTEVISLQRDLMEQGIRVNDPANPGKTYVCGKAITRFQVPSPRAMQLLGTIRANDSGRMARMAEKMAEVFAGHGIATGLDAGKVIDRVAARHGCDRDTVVLQERHVAQAFQERMFDLVPEDRRSPALRALFGTEPKVSPTDAVGIQNELRSFLMKSGKSCFVPEQYVSLAEARELILQLGGIDCYPVVADMIAGGCEFETPVGRLVETLHSLGFCMVEFITVRNTVKVLTEYVTQLRKAGFVVTAGTEHNTLDLIPLEPLCKYGLPIPEPLKDIFWEGTCVLAAHQFLCAQGRRGFVDDQGLPNSQYRSAEDRIKAFKAIGEVVIARYLERHRAIHA
jgi:hypothetical protein